LFFSIIIDAKNSIGLHRITGVNYLEKLINLMVFDRGCSLEYSITVKEKR
jgi:hypothetical protein